MSLKRRVKVVFLCSTLLMILTIMRIIYKQDKIYIVKSAENIGVTTTATTTTGEVKNGTVLITYRLQTTPSFNANYSASKSLPDGRSCPHIKRRFVGKQPAQTSIKNFTKLEEMFPEMKPGGHWTPPNCTDPLKIAIIIPYRDRESHLQLLLLNLIPKLKKQFVDFTIYVVEQSKDSGFNRGLMRNIGFVEANRARKYDCYIFNDVDTLIEDDRNLYTCYPNAAFHIAVSVDRFGYELKYWDLVGGILSLTEDTYRRINGYSNFYFMWGAEDDDLRRRLKAEKVPLFRPPVNISTITTFRHNKDKEIYRRYLILKKIGRHYKKDGVNSVKYELLALEKRKLFTRVYVRVNEQLYNQMLNKI